MKRSVFLGGVLLLSVSLLMTVIIADRFSQFEQKIQTTASAFQPTAPYYVTFFYPWYQNPNTDGRWSQWSDPPNGSTTPHTPPQNWFAQYLPDPSPVAFDPANELYSSNNDQIIYWQLRKLAEAKQEVAIASWWGQTHKTNTALQKIIIDVMNRPDNPYPNLRWSMYYEKEGFGDPPLDTELVPDLKYIITTYTNQPSYFKINGRPVIFVYNAAHAGYSPLNDLNRWQQAKAKVKADTGVEFYIVLKRDPLSAGASINAIDSWHEYAPASRTNTRASLWYMVSPGFWLNGNTPRLDRNPSEFETAVGQMVAADVVWKMTQTWNEWGEGSGVEPADEVNQVSSGTATLKTGALAFKNIYVDILKRHLPALEAGTGAGGTTPTLQPTGTTGEPVIAAVGDMVCGAGSTGAACKQMEVSNLVVQMNPAAFLALGDVQYEAGALSDFQTFYQPSYGRVKNITKPVVGNHEYGTLNAAGYFDYFNGAGNQTGIAGDRSKGYYAYNIGSWRLYALNSNCSQAGGCGVGSPQELWLRADLTANPRQCVLAYYHHPFHGSTDVLKSTAIAPLFKALYDHNAEVVLSGHAHFYERMAPQNVNGVADARGIREFIVGTGGRNFTGFATASGSNSEVRNNTSFGILKLTLRQGSYAWQFVPIPGHSFTDSGTAQCHGSVLATATPEIPTNNPSGSTGTKAALSLFLHGIGKGGDNVNAGSSGNMSPQRVQRNVTIEVFNSTNQLAVAKTTLVSYDPVDGKFMGTADFGNLASGVYTMRLAVPFYLRKTVPGIVSLSAGQTYQLPSTSLTSGDSNSDNRLSMLDYNILLDCFSDLTPARNCSDPQKKLAADLTDDGNVNQFDYNLFLRELSVQTGE